MNSQRPETTGHDSRPASNVQFRAATQRDSSDLAILADAATRRLVSHVWEGSADTGQSNFEVGRAIIRSDSESFSHHSQWRVAEIDGQSVGALNSYLAVPLDLGSVSPTSFTHPLNELKSLAAGTWYISVASVFPENRGQGIGTEILREGQRLAIAAGADRLSLIVGSFNPAAKRLYERFGFDEAERRVFIPFPGSDPTGEWFLMVKKLAAVRTHEQ